jgi:hypothetical protein
MKKGKRSAETSAGGPVRKKATSPFFERLRGVVGSFLHKKDGADPSATTRLSELVCRIWKKLVYGDKVKQFLRTSTLPPVPLEKCLSRDTPPTFLDDVRKAVKYESKLRVEVSYFTNYVYARFLEDDVQPPEPTSAFFTQSFSVLSGTRPGGNTSIETSALRNTLDEYFEEYSDSLGMDVLANTTGLPLTQVQTYLVDDMVKSVDLVSSLSILSS